MSTYTQPNTEIYTTSPNLKFLSWNVAGLNTPIKRKKVLTHLKRCKPDIIFLQETHWRHNKDSGLRANWLGACHTASHTSSSRGVAILFRKGIPLDIDVLKKDPEGRYLIIRMIVNSVPYILVNVYAPNNEQHVFYTKLIQELTPYSNNGLIIGGDFNGTQDPRLDRTHNSRSPQATLLTHSLISLKEHLNICDPWRVSNVNSKEYTCHSLTHDTFSRIDFILISTSMFELHVDSHINPITISDHAPILTQLQLTAPSQKSRNWRFPSYLADSDEFRAYLRTNWNNYMDDNITHKDNITLLWSASKAVMRGHIINYIAHKRKTVRAQFTELHNTLLETQQAYALSDTTNATGLWRRKTLTRCLDNNPSQSPNQTHSEHLL